ncbi:MAG: hypothetical protein AAF726_09615 [Planctomycetota bacterium]
MLASLDRGVGAVDRAVLCQPGSAQIPTLVVDLPTLDIIVRDERGERLEDFEVRVHGASDMRLDSVALRTDAEGVLRLHGCRPPLEIELAVSGYIVSSEQTAGWLRSRSERAWLAHGPWWPPAESRSIELSVERRSAAVRLIDAETRKVLEGPAQVETQVIVEGGAWHSIRAHALPIRGASRRLPIVNHDRHRRGAERLVVAYLGYRPEAIDVNAVLRGGSETASDVILQPQPSKVIRVLDASGHPYRSRLFTRQSTSGCQQLVTPDADGRLPAFAWDGSDVSLSELRMTGNSLTGDMLIELGSVDAATLHQDDEATFVVPSSVGTLVVTDVPPTAPPIIALHESGAPAVAVANSASREIKFSGIACGRVFVGPRAWATQLAAQGYAIEDEDAVSIRSGGTVRIPWDERWSIESPIEGRIEISALEPPEIFLWPLYASTETYVMRSSTIERIPVSEDGRYVIPVGEPLPEVLLVCIPSIGGSALQPGSRRMDVLDAIRPGDDGSVAFGTLQLTWKGPNPPDWLMVHVQLSHTRIGNRSALPALGRLDESIRIEWDPSAPLRWTGVPTSTERLMAMAAGRDAIEVNLDWSRESTLEIDVAEDM